MGIIIRRQQIRKEQWSVLLFFLMTAVTLWADLPSSSFYKIYRNKDDRRYFCSSFVLPQYYTTTRRRKRPANNNNNHVVDLLQMMGSSSISRPSSTSSFAVSLDRNFQSSTTAARRKRTTGVVLWSSTDGEQQPSSSAFGFVSDNSSSSRNNSGNSNTTTTTFGGGQQQQRDDDQTSQHPPPAPSRQHHPHTRGNDNGLRQRVRHMFRTAREYERSGQWGTALRLYRDILLLDDTDSYSHLALANLLAKTKQPPPPGVVVNNNDDNNNNGDDDIIVVSSGIELASQQFRIATTKCPESVHLWQAWGLHEGHVRHDTKLATECFEMALTLDPYNPYVLHAYGYLIQHTNATLAALLWQRALQPHAGNHSTAALVCSYGNLLIQQGQYDEARAVYLTHVERWTTSSSASSVLAKASGEGQQPSTRSTRTRRRKHNGGGGSGGGDDLVREQTEVLLALAYLEERYYQNVDAANCWIDQALALVPSNSLAQVAKARLAGRRWSSSSLSSSLSATALGGSSSSSSAGKKKMEKSTTTKGAETTAVVEKTTTTTATTTTTTTTTGFNPTNYNTFAAASLANAADDGRVYNAWANLHVKRGRYGKARQILQQGYGVYPHDHSLLQAYGAVENRLGNVTGAKILYDASLAIRLSAPCLVSLALLELQQQQQSPLPPPESGGGKRQRQRNNNNNNNSTGGKILPAAARDRFEQALAVDRRHGPAYNAYAKATWRWTQNETATRDIYQRGIRANCSDAASIYHGYAHFELHYMNNYDQARELLRDGTRQFRFQHGATDSPHRDRAAYLFHTLGMLELMSSSGGSNSGGSSSPNDDDRGQQQRPRDALAAFQQGMDYCGKTSPLLLGAALSYIKLGNYEEACTALERSVRRDPCHAQAWHAWGVFETRSGNLETAKILLECGVRKCPRYGALWEALAILKSRLGQVNEARICFEKGIVAEPTRSTLFQNWASLENRQENYNAAKALITKALTMNKRSGGAWIIASEIERQLGNMGLSNLLLRRGIENTPTMPSLYRTLGENLVRDGKIVEARQVFEQGLAVDPLYAPLYHSLAELEARLFNVAGLAELNKRTKELFDTNLPDRPTTASMKNNTGTSNIPWAEQHQQARKKYSYKVPRSVAVLAETIVGGQSPPDYNDDEEDDDFVGRRRPNRDIVGSLQMDDAFLKNVIYGRGVDEPDDL